jgi:hypothetical protein
MNDKTFRVGSVDYTVGEVEGLASKYDLYGQVVYGNTHIELDAGMSPTRKNDVFVHELLHAIFSEAGYREQDEDVINRVAHVLHGVLRDNDFGFIRSESKIEPLGEMEESE